MTAEWTNWLHTWSDAWAFFTAFGTIAMAATTFCVIWQGQRQRKDAERQHRNQFKPVCVLAPAGGVDLWHRRDCLLLTMQPATNNPTFGTIRLNCALRNVGVGPAMKLRVRFKFGSQLTVWWELSPLAAGESLSDNRDPIIDIPIQLHDGFNRANLDQCPGEDWEIWLEYEDVFGNLFRAIHHKRPIQLENVLSAVSGPSFIAPPQPWVTHEDLQEGRE